MFRHFVVTHSTVLPLTEKVINDDVKAGFTDNNSRAEIDSARLLLAFIIADSVLQITML